MEERNGAPEERISGIGQGMVLQKLLLSLLLLVFIAGVGMVLMPFATALMFGAVIALSAWPLRDRLTRAGASGTTAAGVIVTLIIVLTVVPVLAIGPGLADDLSKIVDIVRVWILSAPTVPDWAKTLPFVGPKIEDLWNEALSSQENLGALLLPYLDKARSILIATAVAASESLLQFLIGLVIAAMFWARGEDIGEVVVDVLGRLGGPSLARLAPLSAAAVKGVFYGVVGTAAIQTLMMSGGLVVAGVPGAVPLGFVTMLLALSQIGTVLINLIWMGAAYWIHSNDGSMIAFWFIILWGLLVTTIDGVLKPLLIGKSIAMPMPLVIVGVFGGFLSFGFLGLFIGPVLIAIAYALLGMWRAVPVEFTAR